MIRQRIQNEADRLGFKLSEQAMAFVITNLMWIECDRSLDEAIEALLWEAVIVEHDGWLGTIQ